MTEHGESLRTNEFAQAIGPELPGWTPPLAPAQTPMTGRTCELLPLDAKQHAESLFAAHALDPDARAWTYLPYGPFADLAEFTAWMEGFCSGLDPLLFAIRRLEDERPSGVAGYLRVFPELGSVEVGHVHFSPRLRRTVASTEAMFLLMRRAFEQGYRRYEWKCDAFNAPSRVAALRLGFRYEGTFRNAVVTKGRNRDTAWYSITDAEWLALRPAFERWLDAANFDADGRQLSSLSELTSAAVGPSDERALAT